MKDAAGTWALVVGIDEYQHFRSLKGAAADAVRAVRWLRALGVPDSQIVLNAAPCAETRADVDGLGLPVGGCTLHDVETSFETLIANAAGGARLFVFLSGHGLYDPGKERLFLPSDSRPQLPKNLGIMWYAEMLRGLPYRRQYIVLDACQAPTNDPKERSRYTPGRLAGAPDNAPLPDVAQWLCLAAAAGELALEPGGKSLFTTALLTSLDVDDPAPDCVGIDTETGAIVLDLAKAVDVAAAKIAGPSSGGQNPGIRRLDDGPGTSPVPVVRLERSTATLRIDVVPGDAVSRVEKIKVESDDYDWRIAFPAAPPLVCPISATLPANMRVNIRALVTAPPRPPARDLTMSADHDVKIDLGDPGNQPVTVTTVGPNGDTAYEMTGGAYDVIERLADRAGVGFEHHESGPVFDADRDDPATRDLLLRVADVVNERTDPAVHAVVTGIDVTDVRTTVHVAVEDPKALAGLHAGEPVVTVGDVAVSPADLAADGNVTVEPGRVRVAVTLPWGRWSASVVAREGATAHVTVPLSVGVPPLRVIALGYGVGRDAGERSVVALDRTRLSAVADTAAAVAGVAVPSPSADVPLGTPVTMPSTAPRWRAVAAFEPEEGEAFWVPLSETGAVAVVGGAVPRAEPLSWDPSPDWDALVASGRIEEVPAEAAYELTNRKWFDPLLGLAGAYACYAQHRDEYLDHVLANLRGIDDALPDLALLEAAADSRAGRTRPEVEERLAALADDGMAVPLFRWGLGVGVTGALHYDVPGLVDVLSAVGSRLLPSSLWTMWRVLP